MNASRRSGSRKRPWVSLLSITACSVLGASCVSTSRSITSFGLERSQINRGLLTQDIREDGLDQMARALPPQDSPRFSASPLSSDQSASTAPAPGDDLASSESSARISAEVKRESERTVELPPDSGRLVPLPKMSRTELQELIEALKLKSQTENGYREAIAEESQFLPAAPENVLDLSTLAKRAGDQTLLLRFGYRRFLSQAPQLWLQGVAFASGNTAAIKNADLETVSALVPALITSMAELKAKLTSDDLAFKIIQLSHIDVKGAMLALKGFGFTTLEDLSKLPSPVLFPQLPIIAAMPSPTEVQTGLLGEKTLNKDVRMAFDISITPAVATALPFDANTAPAAQLLVYFHGAHPEQFSRVRKVLAEFIDRPDRQIFVEGMVLEISSEGLTELGIEWQFKEGNFDTLIGSIVPAGEATRTAMLTFDDLKNFDKNWAIRLKALVRDGKAEILSRPTVLTINNRQATIRVGTDIPIATSQEQGTTTSANKIAFDFKYLATGISLNIRPRITESGEEISLMIDTIVSAVVPGADLELRSNSGEVLASAPTISTRRVQTYARIKNNTPFIIGGLVSKEHSVLRDKVPLLGDIPYLGVLFRSKRNVTTKREVIIVLTPRVLQEEKASALSPNLPKDEDRFDQFGNVLFRDSYRIRAEDVLDLSFLQENKPLQRIHQAAQKAIEEDFRLAGIYPFSVVADGRLPGEEVMVNRMIYEVIKRLSQPTAAQKLDNQIELDRLILLANKNGGGFDVEFLERILVGRGDGKNPASFFTKNPGQALLVAFEGKDAVTLEGTMQQSYLPKVRLIPCRDRTEWADLLWKLNQGEAGTATRFAIVIHDPSDLVRLRRAVLVKKIVALNGGRDQMTRKNFGLGKVLLMPEAKPEQTHVLDADVARYFMETEHYYAATLQRIERAATDLDRALQRGSAAPEK